MTTSRLVPEQMIIHGISWGRRKLVVMVGCVGVEIPWSPGFPCNR